MSPRRSSGSHALGRQAQLDGAMDEWRRDSRGIEARIQAAADTLIHGQRLEQQGKLDRHPQLVPASGGEDLRRHILYPQCP